MMKFNIDMYEQFLETLVLSSLNIHTSCQTMCLYVIHNLIKIESKLLKYKPKTSVVHETTNRQYEKRCTTKVLCYNKKHLQLYFATALIDVRFSIINEKVVPEKSLAQKKISHIFLRRGTSGFTAITKKQFWQNNHLLMQLDVCRHRL